MKALLLALVALFVIAVILGLVRLWWYQHKDQDVPNIKKAKDDGCCGQHEVCEKDSLLAAVSRDIVYYEDEDLDVYRGKGSDTYSEEEVEEFQEVLYTLRSEEVAGWVRSLQLRGIELPDALKDEVFMIVGERRQ